METNYTILLIEDNAIDQLVTKQLLKKVLDVPEINVANNGKEGMLWLSNYRYDSDHPLIILLDIQMPEMNGLEFLNEYEKLSKELKQETQIFMLTSSLDSEEIKRINGNNHVTGFLSKPFPAKEFEKFLH
ncbi:MAG: response regulator [Flavobacterium sp.]